MRKALTKISLVVVCLLVGLSIGKDINEFFTQTDLATTYNYNPPDMLKALKHFHQKGRSLDKQADIYFNSCMEYMISPPTTLTKEGMTSFEYCTMGRELISRGYPVPSFKKETNNGQKKSF